MQLYPELAAYVDARLAEFDQIDPARQRQLAELADFVLTQKEQARPARLVFICTHNSRRSHMSQLWAAAAAADYGIDGVETFSGGTERTAFNPRAVAALERAGFRIGRPAAAAANPHYRVSHSAAVAPQECYSKTYTDDPNPREGFCAVMTCSEADQACPMVEGAARRLALPYKDPKVADGTDGESVKYDQRCAQIARELLYAYSQVN